MSDSIKWEKMARYLSGECSSQEKQEVIAWLESAPEDQKILEKLGPAWDIPEYGPPKTDVTKLWKDTAKKAGLRSPLIFAFFRLRFFIYAAASLLFAAGIYFVLQSSPINSSRSALKLERVAVENGRNDELVLSDGSKIILDAGSVFMYPREFGSAAREVYLEGEGYFEVKPDPENPFIVHAQEAVIQVVGTSFNIRAWPRNKKVTVAVASGKIVLHSAAKDPESKVVVSSGQLSILYDNGPPSLPQLVDISTYTGWIRREAFFEDIPLSEILNQLERWFDVRFMLKPESYAEERLTIHIKDKPLENILELIGALTDLEYERFNRSIILRRASHR